MSKVFKHNAEIKKTAYMNWRIDQNQKIHNMLVIADGYTKAAMLLLDDCIKDNCDKKADIVIFPILFSVNHAIELYLKGTNWALNNLLENDEKFCGGHDIRQIWNTVKGLVKKFERDVQRKQKFKEFTKELEEYINELYANIDKADTAPKKMKNMDFSRYPMNSNNINHFFIETFENVVVDLESLKMKFEIIINDLSCLAEYYVSELSLVSDI